MYRLSSIVSRRTKARRGRERTSQRTRQPPRPAWTGKSSRKKKPSHAPTRPASRTHQAAAGGKGPATAQYCQAVVCGTQPRIGLMCDRGVGMGHREPRLERDLVDGGHWRGARKKGTRFPLAWPAIRVFFRVTQGQREMMAGHVHGTERGERGGKGGVTLGASQPPKDMPTTRPAISTCCCTPPWNIRRRAGMLYRRRNASLCPVPVDLVRYGRTGSCLYPLTTSKTLGIPCVCIHSLRSIFLPSPSYKARYIYRENASCPPFDQPSTPIRHALPGNPLNTSPES